LRIVRYTVPVSTRMKAMMLATILARAVMAKAKAPNGRGVQSASWFVCF
jgi:hypothetical protein